MKSFCFVAFLAAAVFAFDSVTLVTNKGTRSQVSMEIAQEIGMVKEVLGDSLDEAESMKEEIPLPNVNDEQLKMVIEFLEHHIDQEAMAPIQRPLKSNIMKEVVSEWYANYVDMEPKKLFDLIHAANYMDVPNLVALSTAKVAQLIYNSKTAEEVEEKFNWSPTNE